MEYFRDCFLAIIAVVSVGFVAAEKSDIVNGKTTSICLAGIDYASCVIGTAEYYNPEVVPTISIPTPPASSAHINCPPQDDLLPARLLYTDIDCDDSRSDIFCCAKLIGPGQFVIICYKIV